MEQSEKNKLFSTALFLGIVTIVYNLIEGIISVYFGIQDESLTLFGFGIDSFIEMLSGIGITHMILRIRKYLTNLQALTNLQLCQRILLSVTIRMRLIQKLKPILRLLQIPFKTQTHCFSK